MDAIKAGRLLASGDNNGFVQGCIGTMAAIRRLRKLPVPKEVVFPATVIDSTNYKAYDILDSQRSLSEVGDGRQVRGLGAGGWDEISNHRVVGRAGRDGCPGAGASFGDRGVRPREAGEGVRAR